MYIDYIDHPIKYVLLFGITQCNNILLISIIFIIKNSISCLDIINHE